MQTDFVICPMLLMHWADKNIDTKKDRQKEKIDTGVYNSPLWGHAPI